MCARVAILALAALALASQTPSAAAPPLRLVFGPGAVPSGSPSFFSVVVPEWNPLELICLNGSSIHVVNGTVVMRLGPAQRLDGLEPAPLTVGQNQPADRRC